MTDTELRDAAVVELKQTTIGYVNNKWTTPPAGTHWAKALASLAKISSPNAALAMNELKQTTVGFKNKYWTTPVAGTRWANALDDLAQIGDASTGFNWFPGHYVLVHNQSYVDGVLADPLCEPFTGFQFRYYWNESEGAQGDYSAGFAQLDSNLAKIASHPGKKHILQLQYKRNDGAHAVPSYLLSAPYCSPSGKACGEMVSTSSTRVAMVWNTTVADRLGKWLAAMVAHCAASPHADLVAGFVLNETSLTTRDTAILNDAGYDAMAYVAGMQHILTAMRQTSDRFVYVYYHEGGFYGIGAGDKQMGDWLAQQTHMGVGTPDMQVLNPKPSGWPGANAAYQQAFPCWPAVQAPDYAASINDSLDHCFRYGVDPAPNGLHASIITWAHVGDPGNFTFADVSRYIPSHPIPNIALPSGW